MNWINLPQPSPKVILTHRTQRSHAYTCIHTQKNSHRALSHDALQGAISEPKNEQAIRAAGSRQEALWVEGRYRSFSPSDVSLTKEERCDSVPLWWQDSLRLIPLNCKPNQTATHSSQPRAHSLILIGFDVKLIVTQIILLFTLTAGFASVSVMPLKICLIWLNTEVKMIYFLITFRIFVINFGNKIL